MALVLKAMLRHIPIDPAVSTQALQAAQTLRSQAGEGTLDTSTVQTLPGHHCGKSRETLYHVLQTYTATS